MNSVNKFPSLNEKKTISYFCFYVAFGYYAPNLGALSKKDTYLIIVSSNLPKGPRPSLKSSAEKQSKSWDMASPNTFCNSSFEPIEPSSAKKNYIHIF